MRPLQISDKSPVILQEVLQDSTSKWVMATSVIISNSTRIVNLLISFITTQPCIVYGFVNQPIDIWFNYYHSSMS